MGTTLQNGVYLPNEGERNCYAGLKTNWEILDQKVADVTALQQAVAGALHREIVASLPTTDIDPNTIYMILSGTSATENVYNEFMYVNNAWELIGTSATDLTNYYTKSEVDGKLLLKANASDLTSHTGDTTIHVTASDKAKWTNSANTHVLRLAKTALTPSSSTNAFSNLDDSTALKVGDKVMDTAGVLFEVTAIDTQNSTFTIGTALIDLAQDSDVVHKSGDETVGGKKTFTDDITVSKNASNMAIYLQNLSYDPKTNGQSGVEGKSCGINFLTSTGDAYINISAYGLSERTLLRLTNSYFTDSQNVDYDSVEFSIYGNGARSFRPRNTSNCDLGESNKKWKGVYATNYYYGSNNVEFSTKFVTTDTAQTVSGAKTFSSNVNVYNSDSATDTANIILKNSKAEVGTEFSEQSINFVDKNNKPLAKINCYGSSGNFTRLYITAYDSNNNSEGFYIRKSPTGTAILPTTPSAVAMGNSTSAYYNIQSNRFNGLEPSSLSLPVAPSSTSFIDISSYITDMTGGVANNFTPPANGYITFSATGTQAQIFSDYGLQSKFSIQSGSTIRGYHPVLKNEAIKIYMLASSIEFFRFIPCQGNV